MHTHWVLDIGSSMDEPGRISQHGKIIHIVVFTRLQSARTIGSYVTESTKYLHIPPLGGRWNI